MLQGNSSLPEWKIPENLYEIVEEDGEWECDDWYPFQLTILGDIQFKGRDIPLCWQVEFDPSDSHFMVLNEKLKDRGLSPDGYGWAEYIQIQIEQNNPEILNEVQFGDTEESTFVAWVESEESCKKLIFILWETINCINSDMT